MSTREQKIAKVRKSVQKKLDAKIQGIEGMKYWYESKTLWVGILEIVGAAGALLVDENLADVAFVTFICGALTVAMRLVTDKGIIK